MKNKYVLWFTEVDKDDIDKVGGKGANLGEMTKAGFPVPPGFIVTSNAYFDFLDENHLRKKIHDLLADLDVSDSKALDRAAKTVQKLITDAKMPKEIARAIIDAYFHMEGSGLTHPLVAVRSSATAEDLPGASFAGQQSTYLNVQGEATVVERVKEAWASLFNARAIFYRQTNNFDHFKVGIAVPVQKMVESDASGIMFTIDPVTNDKKRIMIEAVFGLGELIVQGAVTPDHYEVEKSTMRIVASEVGQQEKKMVKHGTGNREVSLSKKEGSLRKISDEQVLALARLGKKLEKHYYFPQDSEWAIEDGQVYIVQTRPVTTTGKEAATIKTTGKKEVILNGDPASPGMAAGPVKILHKASEIHKIKEGDILVAEQTNPDFVPAMRKAVAIITERGGRTSHAAIVSRELGIPAVVGTAGVLKKVKDDMVVTVNGTTGEIYKGAIVDKSVKMPSPVPASERIKTATRVYVNLAEPSRAEAVSKMYADGVGLLRAEFMIADIGTHPRKMIKDKKQKEFIQHLAHNLDAFCSAFHPRPVVYRTTDFKTNEYRNLKGGAEFEPEEPNPMLGFRGAARYTNDAQVFDLEIEAIKHVRNKLGHKNLWVMIPFVRTPKELQDVKKIMAANGLTRSPTFKLWLMVEIPTNVIRIEDFIAVGIDGVSIGSNDLTMLTLGTDRDNSEVAHDFSEMDPSLLWAFERVITVCNKHGVTSSMCGQAPSDYPELVEKLVDWGITSVSVNPDALDHVRHTVADAEKKTVKKKTKKS